MELRDWLADNWQPELRLVEWRSRLFEAGWAAPSWDRTWGGRGLPAWADALVADELRAAGAPGLPVGVGMWLAAPTILALGPDGMRRRFLRPTVTGDVAWCQLFSEPGAGSDLAGLTTHAVRDGDRWIVNGQKVWTTSAHHADVGMLLARTDWDVPKHRGLTFFVLPMSQPGIEVRPLRQMNRHASFNEVFLTDAEVPVDHVVGEVGGGWAVAQTTLAFERRFGGLVRPRYDATAGTAVAEADAEAAAYFATYDWYPQRAGRADLLADHARLAGRDHDPVVRQRVAATVSGQRLGQWTAARAQAARALGRPPGSEGSIGKLALSNVARDAASAHSLIGGADGMVSGTDGTYGGVVAEVLVSVPAQSIAGGTDEIQRNIIGEKMLGLPREPAPEKDLPFRQVPRNG